MRKLVWLFPSLFLLTVLIVPAPPSAGAPAAQSQNTQNASYDIIIRHGRIVDGSGAGWRTADLGVRNGRIARIGDLSNARAAREIDARGLVVTPGFIDAHMHVEGSLPRRPTADNLVRDGVTSIVTGNCGSSEVEVGAWFRNLEEKGISLNVATLVGHNSVRREVMGTENRAPTGEELQRMIALVERAMRDGAVGLSTGLIYVPGVYSNTDEVVALAQAAARHGGLYATHMRDETDKIFDAIAEAVHVGRAARMPVQISHFKIAGKPLWGRSADTLAAVAKARAQGIDVTVDQYPYAASSTRLDILLPAWALAGGRSAIRKRGEDTATRQKIVAEMLTKPGRLAGWDHLGFAVVANCPWNASLNGKSIREINQSVYHRPDTFEAQVQTTIDMVARGSVGMIYHMMHEDDVRRILANPDAMVGRDGGVKTPGRGKPHPRSYGTAARILGRYVREQSVLTLPQAVRKLAALPAERFGFADRGYLKEGYWADIVIFDPETVTDRATFEEPHQYSTGIPYVLVNGQLVVDNNNHTNTRPGKILRHVPAD